MNLPASHTAIEGDASREAIITRLQRTILPLQGMKSLPGDHTMDMGLPGILKAFPGGIFPVGCVHEFLSGSKENDAAAAGFVAALLGKMMQLQGSVIWISANRLLFPAALPLFGIHPDNIIFIDLKHEKDVLYVFEEALKCKPLSAVVGDTRQISFKASRRLQLAAEQSRVTGFLIRTQPSILNTVACISRWRITSLPCATGDMPGVGYPRWQVELLKIRNGKPGTWTLEWQADHFEEIRDNIISIHTLERKTG